MITVDVLRAIKERGLKAIKERSDAMDVARAARTVDLYLDLLEQTLTGLILNDPGYLLTDPAPKFDRNARLNGLDWPVNAQTMVGLARLKNIRYCIEAVLRDGVEGDFIETGVWRGGSCIYMRAILAAYGVQDRTVWVADSFEGLPPPDVTLYPADAGDALYTMDYLRISLEDVKKNFEKYNMLDTQVRFLKGFFKDTLPTAPLGPLSMMRLDGDMYESTIQALDALYPKLSAGGFVIIDDYALAGCARAVTDFRVAHDIKEPLVTVDSFAVYWRSPK